MQYISDKDNVRIDKYLSETDEKLSRSYIQSLIEIGNILVNGNTVKASSKIQIGDIIDVEIPENKPLEILSQDIDIDIVYEDADVLLVNKAKGMVVHPSHGNIEDTLVNAILGHCQDSLSGINGVNRPGIVHRIDKDTTGIIIVAKNDNAHNELAQQFKDHSINRMYVALVRGIVKDDEATINMPIKRHKYERKKMTVDKDGKRAVTHFKVIERFEEFSLVEFKLETGRTHQIRVHMAQIGHPIVGDPVYSNGKNPFNAKGQLLHAKILGFIHPVTKQYLEFETELPDEMQNILNELRKK